jgi:hypothetical protein
LNHYQERRAVEIGERTVVEGEPAHRSAEVDVDSMTLREAAQRTSRSITTLRRYIRGGRLRADKRPGRFGPEYFVTADDLSGAGLAVDREESAPAALARLPQRAERVLADGEYLPVTLYQELQMKHEQLLVQYGMMRAGGLRALELAAEIQALQAALEEREGEWARLQQQHGRETARLHERLRRTELECEGRGLEIAALREKVRALEMLTRNAERSESIELQFRELMQQVRHVDDLERAADDPPSGPGRPADLGPDH